MLPRNFTEEQNMFRQAYRQFLQAELVPNMDRYRDQGKVDREVFAKAGEQGFLMIWPDEQYGGMGDRDFRFEQIAIEEVAMAGAGNWFATLHSRLVGPYIDKFGSDEQKAKYLPKCASGEMILAIAMTEPDTGSDLAGIRTNAQDMGDHWLLNGSKTFISNGQNCDLCIVAAKTDKNNSRQIGLFLVESAWEGFQKGSNLKKMGMKAQDTSELFFENVKVPKENVLGDPAKGFHYLMHSLAEERLITACQGLAEAQTAFDITRKYVMERKAFGQRIADFQNTQFVMADLRADLDMAQAYIDQCVAVHNEGNLSAVQASQAKLKCTELQGKVVDACVQLHGGNGYMDEYQISRMYADARVTRIYAGTSEIMKMIIAREIFTESYQSLGNRD